jgi:hypothetical protein
MLLKMVKEGIHTHARTHTHTDMLLEMVKEGNQAEERAWVLFDRLRSTSQVILDPSH